MVIKGLFVRIIAIILLRLEKCIKQLEEYFWNKEKYR